MKRILLIIISLAAVFSCTKTEYVYEYVYEKPVMGAFKISAITSQTAILSCSVSKDGGQHVTERGFILSNTSFSNQVPSNATRLRADGNPGLGAFSTELTGLASGKTYYACAYAKSSEGESLSTVLPFTTDVDPAVFLDDVSLDYISYNVKTNGGEYDATIQYKIKFTRADQINTAGIKINGTKYTYSGKLPTADGTPVVFSMSTGKNDDGEFNLVISAFAKTKDGTLLESAEKTFSCSAMGVRVKPRLEVRDCRWYSEQDRQYYSHRLYASFDMIAGPANISRLGYYLDTHYTTSWFGSANSIAYTETTYGTYFSEDGDSAQITVKLYAVVKLKNGAQMNIFDFSTGDNTVTSSYGTSPSYNVFFYEDFKTGAGKLSNIYSVSSVSQYIWQWSSSQYLIANSYSNGNAYAADTRAESVEIDLSGRTDASLDIYCSARYFTDITNEFGIQVHRASTNTWEPLDVSKITNKNYWDDYTFSLNQFVGDKIMLAFIYKGTDESCGSIYLDNIEVYSSANN